MNIIEYLVAKYGEQGPRIVTAMEAKAFGIKYPLQTGWLEKHGAQEITPAVAQKLSAQLYEKGMRSGDVSKANNCLAGAAVLKKIGGAS